MVSTATLIGISAYWLKRDQNDQVARSTYKWAAWLGSVAIVVTLSLGDDTPGINNTVQYAKQAAIAGETGQNLLPEIDARIRNGMKAYDLLQQLRDGNKEPTILADFERYKDDLAYALFLTPVHKQIIGASDKQIAMAAQSILPAYPGLIFWAYRMMIVCGVGSLLIFMLAAWISFLDKGVPAWLLDFSIYLAPVPWIASVLGLGRLPVYCQRF